MNDSFFQAIHQIITTGHAITDGVGQELKQYGMTEPQFNVLRILRGAKGKPITVQEILDNMVQRSSNITRIVDKLIAKGYVERHICQTNRRKMDIHITAEGIKDLKKFDKCVAGFHKPMIGKLTEKELIQLKNLIKKLKS